MTLPSSTIANWPPLLKSVRLTFAKVLLAPPFRVRLTAHTACCCGMPAEARLSSVPSMTDLESRNLESLFLPVPQVIRGWSGSSAIGGVSAPSLGHVYAATLGSQSVPGLAAQAIGSLIEAPLVLT